MIREEEREMTRFLSELIQIDTSNPPGNEAEAAKLIKEKLSEYGIKSIYLESDKNRGNVIAYLGEENKPRLLLLSHLDVVPAVREEWKVDPFSGLIKDGYIWGRGALDDKGPLVAELYAFLAFRDLVDELNIQLMFAATADEEKGGLKGVGWLIENHPEKIRAEYAINEGGGMGLPVRGKYIFPIQTAEKGVYWFRLRVKGVPGHGSIPGSGVNAIALASSVIERVVSKQPDIRMTDHAKGFIESFLRISDKSFLTPLVSSPQLADKVLDKLAKEDKGLAEKIRAMLRNTVTPTMIKGGVKENIIPSLCEVVFDARLLPGSNKEELLRYIKEKCEGLDYELEFISEEEPTESPLTSPLYEAIKAVLMEELENAVVTPVLGTGGTDSRFLRRSFKCQAYGFTPMIVDEPYGDFLRRIHGVDERISIKNLVWSAEVLRKVIVKFNETLRGH